MQFVIVTLGILALVGLVVLVLKLKGESSTAAASPAGAPSEPKEKIHWLVARKGVDLGRSWHIGSRRVTVGRGPTNFVQLKDGGVSRVQCQVVPEGDGLAVLDMTSSNGTFVNGKAVRKHVLANGDLLRVAATELEYQRSGDFENAAFERKEAGYTAHKTTRAVQGLKVYAEAEEHMLRADGDVEKAAASMGIPIDEFRALVDESMGQ
jgi:hypothetical protein